MSAGKLKYFYGLFDASVLRKADGREGCACPVLLEAYQTLEELLEAVPSTEVDPDDQYGEADNYDESDRFVFFIARCCFGRTLHKEVIKKTTWMSVEKNSDDDLDPCLRKWQHDQSVNCTFDHTARYLRHAEEEEVVP